MKKLLFISLLSFFILSCSSDEEEGMYIIHVKNKKSVPCLDEIYEMDLFGKPYQTTESKAKKAVSEANKEAKENYESGKISCRYEYTYTKMEDGTEAP